MMISFAGLPPEVTQAMCTPMHLILPAAPSQHPSYPSHHSPPSLTGQGALYLGSFAAVLEPTLLKEHNIRHIVQVLDGFWTPSSGADGVSTYRIDIQDIESADLKPHLEDAVESIDSALSKGQNVLVHCHQGVSRSASVVIAYLIRKRGMSYQAAAAFVRQRRACIKPNPGFVRCLEEWERQWRPLAPVRTQSSK
ncbi:hypothetical protein HETIRDRAFT_412343 [Heterobasidion irregulare TC 32-1]|uniref:protein-tyrosine-phosphatase n=1 Tax=Heterobasidion irregulare (strain TC 32-1) TaxID=747525 RepID=W4JRP7_HETIT|nr:uncharacterized protein HETIRDRAFT_412343 [Heterobasidion irregulare TC 32-1]ETW76247.1 hypothetical protein HETIRDRAFT_412343 [Heterobasidion irregulare TC 32-1]